MAQANTFALVEILVKETAMSETGQMSIEEVAELWGKAERKVAALEARVKVLQQTLDESDNYKLFCDLKDRVDKLEGELAEAITLLQQARPAVRNLNWHDGVLANTDKFLDKHK